MGIWNISPDALAGGRFVVSPLTETVAALSQLTTGRSAPGTATWLAAHRPGFLTATAADPFASALLHAAFRPGWTLDFITPPPVGDEPFERELDRVRSTPHATAVADLEVALQGPVPAVLAVPELVGAAADLIARFWTEMIEPDWERRRRIFEADIVARTHRLATSGWAAALDGIRPGLRWLGDGRLQINTADYPPHDLEDVDLVFVPISGPRGWSCHHDPSRHALVYPCSGLLATAPAAPPGALAALIGPTRALILTRLTSPLSTSQLVALTGLPLSTVATHLRILLDAGLLSRRRAGRSVLYSVTRSGDQLAAIRDLELSVLHGVL